MSTFPDGFREQAAGESLCLRERKMVLLVCPSFGQTADASEF